MARDVLQVTSSSTASWTPFSEHSVFRTSVTPFLFIFVPLSSTFLTVRHPPLKPRARRLPGQLFPDNDAKWKGASSDRFLLEAVHTPTEPAQRPLCLRTASAVCTAHSALLSVPALPHRPWSCSCWGQQPAQRGARHRISCCPLQHSSGDHNPCQEGGLIRNTEPGVQSADEGMPRDKPHGCPSAAPFQRITLHR